MAVAFGLLMLAVVASTGAWHPVAAAETLFSRWPKADEIQHITGKKLLFSTANPFTPKDVGKSRKPPGLKPAHASEQPLAHGTLFMPETAKPEAPVPAVVLLHGAGGVLQARELTYGRQFAHMGVAALVIDAFAARRHMSNGFTERLLRVTETMAIADAYAGLRELAAMPEVDSERIALIGFSYGGMAALYAAQELLAERFGKFYGLDKMGRNGHGVGFKAHVAFYAPCITRFDKKETTGAPILMMWGEADDLIDKDRCQEVVADLRRGGAEVEVNTFPDAHHQWDGGSIVPWRTARGLADCLFRVEENGAVSGKLGDMPFFLPMIDPLTRRIILAICSDAEGYVVGQNKEVRDLSNEYMGRFLRAAFQ